MAGFLATAAGGQTGPATATATAPATAPTTAPSPPGRPYRYASLKGLSDEEIIRYMGKGRGQNDRLAEARPRTHIQDGFWTVPAKQAALQLAEANRDDGHRQKYGLVLDDRAEPAPPAACFVQFANLPPAMYGECYYYLRVDPNGSFLAYAWTHLGDSFVRTLKAPGACYLRLCDVPYADARKVSDTIWWLRRLRTCEPGGSNQNDYVANDIYSPQGGHTVRLTLRGSGEKAIDANGHGWATLWHCYYEPNHRNDHAVSQGWGGPFGDHVLVNLAQHLLSVALPQRLGAGWSRFDFDPPTWSFSGAREKIKYAYSPAELELIHKTAASVLRLYCATPPRIAEPLAEAAAKAVGDYGFDDQAETLRRIRQLLAGTDRAARTRAVVDAQIMREYRQRHDTATRPAGDPNDRAEPRRLDEELKRIRLGASIPAVRAGLLAAVELSLAQLDSYNDGRKLLDWARSRRDNAAWALFRLRQTDGELFASAVEWRLANLPDEPRTVLLTLLARIDRQRARAIAKAHPARKDDRPDLAAWEKAKAIPNRDRRIDALIAVAVEPSDNWLQRRLAIDDLAPSSQPLKYPDSRIDQAMVKLLDPNVGKDNVTRACEALALRGRVEHFEAVAACLTLAVKGTNWGWHSEILGSLAYLAVGSRPEHRARLQEIIQPHFTHTNLWITNLLFWAWAVDLRGLAGDLERIATAAPQDEEGPRTGQFGGEASPVNERYHLARQVLATWKEEDPLTRGKLLVAFRLESLESLDSRADVGDLANLRLKAALASLAKDLSQGQKLKLAAFVEWYEKTRGRAGGYDCNAVRSALAMPQLPPPPSDWDAEFAE